jgi:UDP-N-acetylmuramate dehydrogenase
MLQLVFLYIMKIQENILLKDLTTLKVGGLARYFCIIGNETDLKETISFAIENGISFFILGGGSNLLFADTGFSGLIIKNKILGRKINDNIITVGSGEKLDQIISFSLRHNLFGFENMSAIPGTIGGAVSQNAGAFGLEMKDIVKEVRGLDTDTKLPFSYPVEDCDFIYRGSIFNKNKNLIITEVDLELKKEFKPNLNYAGLQTIIAKYENIQALDLRKDIIKIRNQRLPDWNKFGTAGSFFKNPIIKASDFNILKERYPELPGFIDEKQMVKISLGWVLDKICNLKGYREGEVGLYEHQALVLVNFGQATSEDIKNFSQKIKNIVKEKIGIEIEEEVEKLFLKK